MTFRCRKCILQFEEERRLEIHKKTQCRKSRVSEYGRSGINNDGLEVTKKGHLSMM
jgi:hypothetical protein